MNNIKIMYNGVINLAPLIVSCAISDAIGEASTAEVELIPSCAYGVLPSFGDSIGISFITKKGESPETSYTIQEVKDSGGGTLSWSAVAKPIARKSTGSKGKQPPTGGAIMSKAKTETLTFVSFAAYAAQVAKEADMKLLFTAPDKVISKLARYQETGYYVLSRLCSRYGYFLRVEADRIVITAGGAKSTAIEVLPDTIVVDGISSYSLQPKATAGAVVVKSYDKRTKKMKTVRVELDGIGADEDIDAGEGVDEDEMQDVAAGTAQKSRRAAVSASVVIRGDYRIFSGCIVDVKDAILAGTYRVTRADHTLDGGGYVTSLEIGAL